MSRAVLWCCAIRPLSPEEWWSLGQQDTVDLDPRELEAWLQGLGTRGQGVADDEEDDTPWTDSYQDDDDDEADGPDWLMRLPRLWQPLAFVLGVSLSINLLGSPAAHYLAGSALGWAGLVCLSSRRVTPPPRRWLASREPGPRRST